MMNATIDCGSKSYRSSMKIIPQNDQVLCRMITSKTKPSTSGIICEVPDVQTYEVLAISKNFDNHNLGLKIGNVIVCNSTGTLLEDPALSEKLYLFASGSIVAKVS